MIRPWALGLSSLVSGCACLASFFGVPQSLNQDWVGELRISDTKRFVQLRLASDRPLINGKIGFPASGLTDIPLSDVFVDEHHVKFAWNSGSGQESFDGAVSAGLLVGTERVGSQQGTLQLTPTVALSAEAQDLLIGYYEMRPGHLLSVT